MFPGDVIDSYLTTLDVAEMTSGLSLEADQELKDMLESWRRDVVGLQIYYEGQWGTIVEVDVRTGVFEISQDNTQLINLEDINGN